MVTKDKELVSKPRIHIDERMKNIVSLLNNLHPKIWVSSNGQGNIQRHISAHVFIYCETPSSDGAYQFSKNLAAILSKNDGYDTDIALEWTGDKEVPFVSLSIMPQEIDKITTILSDHRNELLYGI